MCEVLKKHKPSNSSNKHIKINVKEPSLGFQQLQEALDSMTHDAVLAHLPENVMKAVSWLYDDDITAARAMLAEAESLENDSIRSSARREIELLRRTIQSGQIKAASYNVTMPAGKLSVIAYTPSKCYVATVCFGQDAPETNKLRAWRDDYLLNYEFGKNFVVWYYNNGEKFADIAKKHPAAKLAAKILIRTFTLFVAKHKLGARDGR